MQLLTTQSLGARTRDPFGAALLGILKAIAARTPCTGAWKPAMVPTALLPSSRATHRRASPSVMCFPRPTACAPSVATAGLEMVRPTENASCNPTISGIGYMAIGRTGRVSSTTRIGSHRRRGTRMFLIGWCCAVPMVRHVPSMACLRAPRPTLRPKHRTSSPTQYLCTSTVASTKSLISQSWR